MYRRNKAQNFVEYAMLIIMVVGVFIAMRTFMVRVVQEKLRQGADVFGGGEQYEKGITVNTITDGDTYSITTLPPDPDDPCSFVVNLVAILERLVSENTAKADSFDARAAGVEAQVEILRSQGLTEEADRLAETAAYFREQASYYRAIAADKQQQIDGYKAGYPDCFS